jgi:hypothetical protein
MDINVFSALAEKSRDLNCFVDTVRADLIRYKVAICKLAA